MREVGREDPAAAYAHDAQGESPRPRHARAERAGGEAVQVGQAERRRLEHQRGDDLPGCGQLGAEDTPEQPLLEEDVDQGEADHAEDQQPRYDPGGDGRPHHGLADDDGSRGGCGLSWSELPAGAEAYLIGSA